MWTGRRCPSPPIRVNRDFGRWVDACSRTRLKSSLCAGETIGAVSGGEGGSYDFFLKLHSGMVQGFFCRRHFFLVFWAVFVWARGPTFFFLCHTTTVACAWSSWSSGRVCWGLMNVIFPQQFEIELNSEFTAHCRCHHCHQHSYPELQQHCRECRNLNFVSHYIFVY
jgi:hypothetical protein